MNDLSGNQKRLVFLLLFAIILGSGALLYRSLGRETTDVITLDLSGETQGEASGTDWRVIIHLCGAVVKPGVYSLPQGARLYQALTEAGGALSEADLDSLNLAAPVRDGERIYIPFQRGRDDDLPRAGTTVAAGESPQALPRVEEKPTSVEPSLPSSPSSQPFQGRIDPNTANSTELQSIPGIGPALAGRIIAYRQQHGRFQTIDDLLQVKGIGAKTLEKIKAYLIIVDK